MTTGAPPPEGNCCGNPRVPGVLSWMPFLLSFLVSDLVAHLLLWWLSESMERNVVLAIMKIKRS